MVSLPGIGGVLYETFRYDMRVKRFKRDVFPDVNPKKVMFRVLPSWDWARDDGMVYAIFVKEKPREAEKS